MSSVVIDTDDGISLDIFGKQGRTFSLDIDLQRSLVGYIYKMAVINSSGSIKLAFAISNGITIVDTKITLNKSYTEMQIDPGVYRYDLIEVKDNVVNNIAYGNFIIQPSATVL